MLPTIDALRDAHAFMAWRHGWRRPLDIVGIEEALHEAAKLADGRVDDEPAALLLALLRRPNDLTDGWPLLAYVLVENQARVALRAELRLDPSDHEVRELRMRIIARDPRKRANFDDVCAFVTARLRPLP